MPAPACRERAGPPIQKGWKAFKQRGWNGHRGQIPLSGIKPSTLANWPWRLPMYPIGYISAEISRAEAAVAARRSQKMTRLSGAVIIILTRKNG